MIIRGGKPPGLLWWSNKPYKRLVKGQPNKKDWNEFIKPWESFKFPHSNMNRALEVLCHVLPRTTRALCPDMFIQWKCWPDGVAAFEQALDQTDVPTEDEVRWVNKVFGSHAQNLYRFCPQTAVEMVQHTNGLTADADRWNDFWDKMYAIKRRYYMDQSRVTELIEEVPDTIRSIPVGADHNRNLFMRALQLMEPGTPMACPDVVAVCHVIQQRGQWWRYADHLFFVFPDDADKLGCLVVPIGRLDRTDRFLRVEKLINKVTEEQGTPWLQQPIMT